MKNLILVILLLWSTMLFGQEQNEGNYFMLPSHNLKQHFGFSCGLYDNYLLVLGGTISDNGEDDLLAMSNSNLLVLDWRSDSIFGITTQYFPTSIKEQLTASGMAYWQEEDTLYVVGGYGFRSSVEAFSTIPALMIIDVPKVVQAILQKENPLPYIRQVLDERLAIKDAFLEKSGVHFFLAEGEKAYIIRAKENDAFYFVESCYNQVRTFKVKTSGEQIDIVEFQRWDDLDQFYDAFESILPGTYLGNGSYRFKQVYPY